MIARCCGAEVLYTIYGRCEECRKARPIKNEVDHYKPKSGKVLSFETKRKNKLRGQKWRAANKEKIKATAAKYRAENKDVLAEVD